MELGKERNQEAGRSREPRAAVKLGTERNQEAGRSREPRAAVKAPAAQKLLSGTPAPRWCCQGSARFYRVLPGSIGFYQGSSRVLIGFYQGSNRVLPGF